MHVLTSDLPLQTPHKPLYAQMRMCKLVDTRNAQVAIFAMGLVLSLRLLQVLGQVGYLILAIAAIAIRANAFSKKLRF